MIIKIWWLLAATLKNIVSPAKLVLCFPKTGSTVYRMREMLLIDPEMEVSHEAVNSFSAEIGSRESIHSTLVKSHYAVVGLLFLSSDISILVRQPKDALISLHAYLVRNGVTQLPLNDYLKREGIQRYRRFLFFTKLVLKVKSRVVLVRYENYLVDPWRYHANADGLSVESLHRISEKTSRDKTTKTDDKILDKEFSKEKNYAEVQIDRKLEVVLEELTEQYRSL